MKTTKKILFTVLALFLLLESCDLSTIFDKDKENSGTEYPSGFVKNPETGAIYNPNNGANYDPTTGTIIPDGFVVDPETGKIYNPETGEVYDPDTGKVTDPNTGETRSSYNPKTGNKLPDGFIVDPETGKIYNPDTGEVYDPETGKITDPNTGEVKSVYDPKTELVETTNPETGEKEYSSPSGGIQYNKDGTIKDELYYFLDILSPAGAGNTIVENGGLVRKRVKLNNNSFYPILKDSEVTLLFKGTNGYTFTDWVAITGEDDLESSENPFTFTMSENTIFQVNGTGDTSQLFFTLQEDEDVEILLFGKPIKYTIDDSNRLAYHVMNGVKLEFRAKTDREFDSFVVNGAIIKKNPLFYSVNEDLGISINTNTPKENKIKLDIEYPLNSAEISITSDGKNIIPTEQNIGKSSFYIDPSSYITITGNPNDGFSFLEWRGDINSSENPLVTNIKENTKLVFFTEENSRKIRVDYENAKIKLKVDGIVIPQKNENGVSYYEVKKGDLVVFEVFPDKDYVFKSWRGDLEREVNPLIERINNDISIILEVEKYYYELGLTYTNMNVEVSSGGLSLLPYKQDGNKRFYKTPKGVYTSITSKPYKGYLWNNWSGDLSSATNPYTVKLDSSANLVGSLTKDILASQYGAEITSMNIIGSYTGSSTMTEKAASDPRDFAKVIKAKVNKSDRESDKPTLDQILSTPSSSYVPYSTSSYKVPWKQYYVYEVFDVYFVYGGFIPSSRSAPKRYTRDKVATVKRKTYYKFVKDASFGEKLLDDNSDLYQNLASRTGVYLATENQIINLNGNGVNLTKHLNFVKPIKSITRETRSVTATLRWVRDEVLETPDVPFKTKHFHENMVNMAAFSYGLDIYSDIVGFWAPISNRNFENENIFGALVGKSAVNPISGVKPSRTRIPYTGASAELPKGQFPVALGLAGIPLKESDTGDFEYTLYYNEAYTYTPEKFVFNRIEVALDLDAITIESVQVSAGIKHLISGDGVIFNFESDPKYYFKPGVVYQIGEIRIKSKTTGNTKSVPVWLN